MKICPNGHRIKDQAAEYCSACGAKLERYDGPLKLTYAVHSEKDNNREYAEMLGLTGEAVGRFVYTALEVLLEVEVDAGTGYAKCVGVYDGDGQTLVKLERPVSI